MPDMKWIGVVGMFALALACGHGQPLGAHAAEMSKPLPALPEKVASFGAVACDGWLYVYSGHIGTAHEHSRDNLSKRFSRLKIDSPDAWQTLPMGTALQSVALVSHGGKVYRVAGLSARNAAGEKDDLHSSAEFARFDPQAETWQMLTPLPDGRSSHDAVVVGDWLYVIGGWRLGGEEPEWLDHALQISLTDPQASWQELPKQPFRRRALAVAEHGGKIYALGGMNSSAKASTDVHIFDLKSQTWSQGSSIPGETSNGFGCAAAGGDRLVLSTMDGSIFELAADGKSWNEAGKLKQSRFFHRLLPQADGSYLAVAGASMSVGHLDSIERWSPAK